MIKTFLYVQQTLAGWLYARSRTGIIIISLISLAGIGIIDYFTGTRVSFSIFYLGPISLAAWFARRTAGILVSLDAAIVWFIADVFSGTVVLSWWVVGWNALVRLSFFLLTTWLLSEVHRRLEYEERLASIDYLTGAANSREFYERTAAEIDRARRYRRTFTLAYIDLDNFKQVNDSLGHQAGDDLLKTVVSILQQNTRRTDTVARLGGDEFALLLPETGPEAAREVVDKNRSLLLKAMGDAGWPVTFSIGAAGYEKVFPDVRQAIKNADDLMYHVKRNAKNAVLYRTFG